MGLRGLNFLHLDVTKTYKANCVLANKNIVTESIRFFMIKKSDAFLSEYLTDLTLHRFIKNCPQWDLNSQPPDHQSHALPTLNLLEICKVRFLLFHALLHMLDFVYFWNQ